MGKSNNLNKDLEPVYYTAPIELWQEFLDSPLNILEDVLAYASAKYNTEEEASNKLNVKYGEWENTYAKGKELRELGYCGVNFSISQELYWDYRNNGKKKTEYDNLLLLAYLALNSMRGNLTFTNSLFWFSRMAGYGSMDGFRSLWEKKDRKTGKVGYHSNRRIAKYVKSKQILYRTCAKIRLDLMRKFPHVHFYSEQGKRDFAFMFDSKRSRQECMDELAELMHQRGITTQRDALKEMMMQAKQKTSK